MKKLFFVSLFGLLLAACGGGDPDNKPNPKPDPDEPTRDTEQVWRTKALNAVAELESIAERTNEIVEEVEYWIGWFINSDPRFEIGMDDFDEKVNEIYDSSRYIQLEQDIDSWKDKHKLDNYPLTKEQIYNQIIDLHKQCVDLFKQARKETAYDWWWADDNVYDNQVNYNNSLYNEITQELANIKRVI